LAGAFTPSLVHAACDLVLVVDVPAEMIEARRLAVGLVLQQRERDVAVGHIDRLAAGHALAGEPLHLEGLLVELRQALGIRAS